MKRVLSVMLVIVLGLALLVPVMASEATESANAPVITRQPAGPSFLFSGLDFVLEAEAELPEGVEGELHFFWFEASSGMLLGFGPRVTVSTAFTDIWRRLDLSTFDMARMLDEITLRHYVVVVNNYYDEYGRLQRAETTSEITSTMLMPNYGSMISFFWNDVMTRNGFLFLLMSPILLLVAPAMIFSITMLQIWNWLFL